jgi:hypothetical protein
MQNTYPTFLIAIAIALSVTVSIADTIGTLSVIFLENFVWILTLEEAHLNS